MTETEKQLARKLAIVDQSSSVLNSIETRALITAVNDMSVQYNSALENAKPTMALISLNYLRLLIALLDAEIARRIEADPSLKEKP